MTSVLLNKSINLLVSDVISINSAVVRIGIGTMIERYYNDPNDRLFIQIRVRVKRKEDESFV